MIPRRKFINISFPDPSANTDAVFKIPVSPFKQFRISHINCDVTNGDVVEWMIKVRIGDPSNTGRIQLPGPIISAVTSSTFSASFQGELSNVTTNGEIGSCLIPSFFFDHDVTVRLSPNGGTTFQFSNIQVIIEVCDE